MKIKLEQLILFLVPFNSIPPRQYGISKRAMR